MRLGDLTKGPVATVEPDDTLQDAARELEDNGITALAVCSAGELVGILTAADLVRAAADGVQLARTIAQEYMTTGPVCVREDADPALALRTMLDQGFDHLPVLDSSGDVCAVLTMRDVAEALVSGRIPAAVGRRT